MAIFARTAMTNNQCKVRAKYYLRLLSALLGLTILTLPGYSSDRTTHLILSSLTVHDTVPSVKDTFPAAKDSLRRGKDTLISKVDTFNVPLSSDSISAPVVYSAADSMVLDVGSKKIFLYGRSEVRYTDVTLNAPEIAFDQASQMVTARMTKDSTGTVVGMAKLKQAETMTVSDSIKFNFKSQRGLTHNSFFQQQEIYNFAEKVKKMDAETFFAYRGRFTTCNLDTPHFAFRFKKAKFVNQKVAVTGPVHPEFEDVPIPIYLPFGIFPLASGRRSGILPPQVTFTQDFGIGLEGMGYYKVFNEYLDAKIWADLYSYGSWRLNLAPTYRVRYKYSGGFTLSYQNTKFAFKGDPDYSQTKSFFVTWNHMMDSKARPGVTFTANGQAGSSKYLRLVPNGALMNPGSGTGVNQGTGGNYSQPINFTNQLSSSISWQKQWIGRPYALSVNLNHNQNTQTGIVNLNLPDIGFVVNTVYPFQPKDFAGGNKWYEKLGIGYNGNVKSQVSFYDSTFNMGQLIDTLQWGANHEIPILLSLPALGPFQIAPNISYRERWYGQKFFRNWNPNSKQIDTVIKKGFYSAREMNMGISVNTAIFGTFISGKKDARIQAIRHVMRPTFGINYKPDLMEEFYYREQVDTLGNEILFSTLDGSIYGPFSPGRNGGINFGLDNNIEMKVRSKTDTGENAFRKVKLLDGFGINGGYNFLADSFKLSTLSLYARSMLFEKINITANATLDPYQFDERGYRKDVYAWEGGKFSPGTITSGSLNVSTNFQSKKKEKDKKEDDTKEDQLEMINQDQLMQQLDYVRRNPAEFADFNVAWSLNVGMSLQFARVVKSDYSGFRNEFTSSANFNGDFNLTPKWKVGATGFYDLKNNELQSLTTFISRDLHCWQLSINITPVGLYRFFSININPKSALLRDLKVNRTRYFYNR
jgi:hypothetical protein